MNREELDLKMSKCGYEHPEENNSNISAYKVYNSENKNNEAYSTTTNYDIYSKFDSVYTNSPYNFCPVCTKRFMYMCDCEEFKDRMCPKGHTWYVKGEKVVIGDPHKHE
jgi:hypothetical protein